MVLKFGAFLLTFLLKLISNLLGPLLIGSRMGNKARVGGGRFR